MDFAFGRPQIPAKKLPILHSQKLQEGLEYNLSRFEILFRDGRLGRKPSDPFLKGLTIFIGATVSPIDFRFVELAIKVLLRLCFMKDVVA